MKIIELSNGRKLLVDDEDYELVSNYNWYYLKNSTNGYVRTLGEYKGVRRWFYIHQLIMGTIGTTHHVDHKNCNGLDNQRSNLRLATRSDNSKNRAARGSSQYMGVSIHLYNKWLARININGKQKHLGTFFTEIEAARAYNEAAIATGNPFYKINTI